MFIPDPYLEIPRGLSSPKDLWALLVKSLRPRSLVMEAALAPYQWKLGGFFPWEFQQWHFSIGGISGVTCWPYIEVF